MRVIFGASWCNSSTRLAPRRDERRWIPVTWPPGWLRLSTKPKRTGSAPIVKTTGTEELASLAACAEATSPVAAIATTPLETRSAARRGSAP